MSWLTIYERPEAPQTSGWLHTTKAEWGVTMARVETTKGTFEGKALNMTVKWNGPVAELVDFGIGVGEVGRGLIVSHRFEGHEVDRISVLEDGDALSTTSPM